MKKWTFEERNEIVDRCGISVMLALIVNKGGMHSNATRAQVTHDTALHFLWDELSWEKRRRCSRPISDAQWKAFLDGAKALNASEVIDSFGFMARIIVGEVTFFAYRFGEGIELSLKAPHNLYGPGTRHITALSVRDALYLIEECAADERLLSGTSMFAEE